MGGFRGLSRRILNGVGLAANHEYRALTLREFVYELSMLGLANRCFGYEEYAARLGDRLGLEIRISRLNDFDHPLLRAGLVRSGISGGLFLEPERGRAWILLPDSLNSKLRAKVAYHELGHLAGGHPVPRRRLLSGLNSVEHAGARDEPWYPESRLALRNPPADPTLCERDADLRGNYAFKMGLFGDQFYNRDELLLGLKDA